LSHKIRATAQYFELLERPLLSLYQDELTRLVQ
jgi:hypothetical protein